MRKKWKRAKAKRVNKKLALQFTFIAAALIAGLAIGVAIQERLPAEIVVTVDKGVINVTNISVANLTDLSLEGFVAANVTIERPATVVITSGCWQLSALTTEPQAYSLELGLKNQTPVRPQTHDLMRDVFENLGIEVLQAKINGFSPDVGTYVARLILRQGNTILNLDARPTDTIGIASRMNVSIYINQSLLETYGRNIC